MFKDYSTEIMIPVPIALSTITKLFSSELAENELVEFIEEIK
jgi:hypothetical protein